jgi:hypothetical protein
MNTRAITLFAGVGILYVLTGVLLSWNVSLNILMLGLLSAIMALGVNMQWGYAGLFSTGIVGSIALGGLAVVFVSGNPVPEAFAAGGWQAISGLAVAVAGIAAAVAAWTYMSPGRARNLLLTIDQPNRREFSRGAESYFALRSMSSIKASAVASVMSAALNFFAAWAAPAPRTSLAEAWPKIAASFKRMAVI